jgi:MFS family permease
VARDVSPLRLYLLGTGSWFLAFGIQSVMFAWLVTLVLRESPENVGVAQMALLVPGMLFMLVGGSLADHLGGRRVALVAQAVAALPPLLLLLVIARDALSFSLMLIYAVVMGLASAFLTPSRDALLNQVAVGTVQRTVVQTSVIQFGAQFCGFLIASFAERVGAWPILTLQCLVLAAGVLALRGIRAAPPTHHAHQGAALDLGRIAGSIAEGARTVAASPPMRMIAAQNCAMGLCFMGSYIVTLPLLIREVHDGTSADLGLLNAANSLGLVLTIIALMRFGDIRRQGRAVLLAQGIGAVVLGVVGFGVTFSATLFCVFLWGMCGGVAMSMSRTIMQEQAPAAQRGRVMSFYSFSFMGSGPIGALVNGYLVEWLGPERALIVACATMLAVMIAVSLASSLWRLEGPRAVSDGPDTEQGRRHP